MSTQGSSKPFPNLVLSPQNYHQSKSEIISFYKTHPFHSLHSQTFHQMAITNKAQSLHAKFCLDFSSELNDCQISILFKRHLLIACQHLFENRRKLVENQLENLLLVGELYMMGAVDVKITLFIFKELLAGSDLKEVECSCHLFKLVGEKLEQETPKNVFDWLFEKLQMFQNQCQIVQQVIDMKRNDWQITTHIDQQLKTVKEALIEMTEEKNKLEMNCNRLQQEIVDLCDENERLNEELEDALRLLKEKEQSCGRIGNKLGEARKRINELENGKPSLENRLKISSEELECSVDDLLKLEKTISESLDLIKEKRFQLQNNNENNELVCVVCLDKKKDTLFMPCNHLCTCYGCGVQLDKCPLCRKKISNKVKTIM